MGQFINGSCSAAVTVTASVYVCETAKKEIRGMLGGTAGFLNSIGIFCMTILGSYAGPWTSALALHSSLSYAKMIITIIDYVSVNDKRNFHYKSILVNESYHTDKHNLMIRIKNELSTQG